MTHPYDDDVETSKTPVAEPEHEVVIDDEEGAVVGETTQPDVVEKQPETKEPVKQELTDVKEEDLFGDDTDHEVTIEDNNDAPENTKYVFEPRQLDVKQCRAHRTDTKKIPSLKKKKVLDLKNEELSQAAAIMTVRGTAQSIYATLERLPQSFFDEGDVNQLQEWFALVQNAQNRFMLPDDQMFEAVVRNGSVWVNMVDFATEADDGPRLKGLATDRKGMNPGDKTDKKSVALTKVLGSLGLGSPAFIPLYQTGIWVRITTPSAAAFVKLDEQISKEKVHYGSETRGEIYNNQSVLIRKHVANFILDHIDWSTAPSDDPDYLKSIIKATDLDALMIGLMHSRYPDGYPLTQTCTVDPTKCTHTEEGLVDLRELVWTDKARLTEKQKRLISNPLRKLTEAELQQYQDEFKTFRRSRIAITKNEEEAGILEEDGTILNGLIINLEEPSLEKEEDYGIRWINQLVRNAEDIFREKHSEKERKEKIQEQVLVSYFKTYGQWVKSMEIYEGGVLVREVTDEDELDELFDFLSSEMDYVQLFRKEVQEYIKNNILTVIGILNYECPNCGKKHDTPEGSHYLILPIDILYTFFIQVRTSVKRSFRQSII